MTVREMVLAALIAALTAVGALVAIPLTPVPFTLQVLFVLMAGLLLRPGAAAASMTVYVLLGVAGLPVFSGGQAGLGVLFGPRGGYLFGFLMAAVVVAMIAGPTSGRGGFVWRIGACLAGVAFIYAMGMVWLAAETGMGLWAAFAAGVLPFIPLDVVKAFIAVVGVEALERVRAVASA